MTKYMYIYDLTAFVQNNKPGVFGDAFSYRPIILRRIPQICLQNDMTDICKFWKYYV